MNVYLGSAKWGWHEWAGSIYPLNADPKDFLYYYSRKFSTVELNPTFYDEDIGSSLKRWKRSVPEYFKFCPKFPSEITHEKFFDNCGPVTKRFLGYLDFLGDNLGISYIQLKPEYASFMYNNLLKYIEILPQKYPVSLELRGVWLKIPKLFELIEFLKSHNIGIVIPDNIESVVDLHKLELTNNTVMVRFTAYNHKTDFTRIETYSALLEKWQRQGINDVYFFIHEFDGRYKVIDYAVNLFCEKGFNLVSCGYINKETIEAKKSGKKGSLNFNR